MLCVVEGGISTDSASGMDSEVTENYLQLNTPAYVAGDTVTGTINVKSSKHIELLCLQLELVGAGMTLYHKACYRTQRFCELKNPTISVKEYCTEPGRAWTIPFTLTLPENLISTIDAGKKGRVCYYIAWELQGNVGEVARKHEEIVILATHSLDNLPRNVEMSGDNIEEEEYDNMKLQLYSPVSAYLPGEQVQYRAYVLNLGNKLIKKIAVLLIQNVLFYKSSSEEDAKGRTRSFLMSVKEKVVKLKQDEEFQWEDEIQIPDPVAPSADGFHKINYEIVLVALTKGKKSNIRAVFDQARYHFDLARYQDDYFRDFLPHAPCSLEVGSHHGVKRSVSMTSGEQGSVTPLNEVWKQKTQPKNQRARKMPRVISQGSLSRITFNPNFK